MNKKQSITLAKVFEIPTRSDIIWNDIVSMVEAAGAKVGQREGSRVSFSLSGVVAVFHQPHPNRHAPYATVRGVRDFLERAGVMP